MTMVVKGPHKQGDNDMLKATHTQIAEILKTLPIGLYLGDRTPVIYEQAGDSYANLMDGTIHISGETVMHGLEHLPETTNPYGVENAVRCILYHELSHVIMTPKTLKMDGERIVNIFEDERIETLLSKYYLGVNFKKMCMAVNGWTKDWKPEDARTYFYGIVRFRQGPEKFLRRVERIISRFSDIRAFSSSYDADAYRDEIMCFWEDVRRDWNQNRQQRQDEQEQRNQERNQKEEQDKQNQQGQQGQSGNGDSQQEEGDQQQEKGDNQQNESSDKDQDKGGSNGDEDEKQDGESGNDSQGNDEDQDDDKQDGSSKGAGSEGDDADQQESDNEDDGSEGQGDGTDGEGMEDVEEGANGHGKTCGDRDGNAKEQQSNGSSNGEEGEADEQSEDDGEQESAGEREARERAENGNADEIDEITRESIAGDVKKLLGKFHDEKVGHVLERLIIQHNKKRASRTPMSRGYTGKVGYKEVATRQDYRWFIRKGGDGENKFGSTHFTLWVDCSGSFYSEVDRINSVIHELNRLTRRMGREFSFDVVQMTMHNKVVPTTVELGSNGCNGFGPGVEECIRKTRKQGCNNYNVVVWDGDMFSGFSRGSRERYLPVLRKAFNNQNTVIVTDGENERYTQTNTPNARVKIIHNNYASNFVNALLELLAQVLV